jgi:catechol 2,3-dioxygenase-like lactoylglutathione lyase family enzyme
MAADTLCWTDIPVTDLDRAIQFYSAVLGKEVRKMSEGGFDYGLLPHEEQNASGCLCLRGDSVGDRNEPAERFCKIDNRSGRTGFAPWSSIPKVIGSRSIPLCDPGSLTGAGILSNNSWRRRVKINNHEYTKTIHYCAG